MSRRGGRRGDRSSERVLVLEQIERILEARLWSWARADSVTLASGKVNAWQDRVLLGGPVSNARSIDAAHAYVQATSGQQGTPSASSPTVNRRASVLFAGGQRYLSTLGAANWAFSADGTGFRCVVIAASSAIGTQVLYGTTSNANVQGISAYCSGATVRRAVYKSGASAVSDAQYGTFTPSAAFVSDIAHSSGTPNHSARLNQQAVVSGAYASAPSAGASGHAFGFGANSGPSAGLTGEIADILIANTVDAGLAALIRRYVMLRYRLPM